jgi:hypothetical protein
MSALLTAKQAALRRARSASTGIIAPNGRPASQYLYPSPRTNSKNYRPRQQLRNTTRENITEADRLELINYSRQLYAQVGDVATAIDQKNHWAFGDAWEPHFIGEDTRWGEELEEWLKNAFYPTCNVRGPLYHFTATLQISGKAWDYDGDDLEVYTKTDRGFPQIAVFPSTMVRTHYQGQGYGRAEVVQGGPFDGAKICDGVIYNRNNRAIGVRLWDEDGKHTDISLFNADLAYEPSWSDQGRGIPRLSTCLLRWMSLQDIDHFLQMGMKRAATLQINRFTPEGESVQGNEIITGEETVLNGDGDEETRATHTEMVGDGGDIIEFSTEEGEELKILEFRNPHPNSEAFVERIKRECLSSVGWFYELLNMASTGRAPSRLVCNLANKTIWNRQATGERRAKRRLNFAIAVAMQEGLVSKNKVGGIDPYRWEFGLPAELTVDEGNNEQAAREAVKMGMSSKKIEAQKKGRRDDQIHKDIVREVTRDIKAAKSIGSAEGVPFELVWERLDQRSPNPITYQPQKQQNQSQQPEKK